MAAGLLTRQLIRIQVESEHYARKILDPRVRSLERWREDMAQEAEIQRRIKEDRKLRNRLELTITQKVGGAILGAIVVAESLKGLFGL